MAKHHYLQLNIAFQKFLCRVFRDAGGRGNTFNGSIVNLPLNLMNVNYAQKILALLKCMATGSHFKVANVYWALLPDCFLSMSILGEE